LIKLKVTNNLEQEIAKAVEAKALKAKQALVEKLAAATPVDTGRARNGWRLEGDKIINDVDYISELNHGSSKQAPSHFIEKTILADSTFKLNGSITIDR